MNHFYRNYGKRAFDIIISVAGIIILLPLLLILSLLVRIKLGSPVIFTQERPGKDEEIFKLYKFRTMTNERNANGQLLDDSVRLTAFGKFLRSMSLDELPELWNILKGEMSVVGPRPLLLHYLPLYNDYQRRRHEVKPGLTGYAQVNGRNTLSWSEKFDMDIKYVDAVTFLLDIQIIFQTIITVLKREGISSETSVTTEYFTGNED